jgi:ATP-dependent protease ClpP protease subunit
LVQEIPSIITPSDLTSSPVPVFDPAELIEYLGTVNYATSERALSAIKSKMAAGRTPTMLVTSAGGPSGTAMSFYDTVRYVLKAPLVTIGSGDVDSSGIIIYLSGERRYVTKHTTLLLHPAGRSFDPGKRYTVPEMAAMVAEDRLKDAQYASVVAECSRGTLSQADVLSLMDIHTVLRPEDLLRYRLADAVLG